MNQVKFYYGDKSSYNATTHQWGVYFAKDTLEILVNGDSYGGKVTSASVNGNDLVLTLSNGETVTVTFPNATDSTSGMMSAEDKKTIDNLASEIQEAIESAISNLNYNDSVANGSFVTSVTETDGVIKVTRGTVTSVDGSVTITSTDGNIDLAVTYPEEAVYNGTQAINVNDHTISLTIASQDKILSLSTQGLTGTVALSYDSNAKTITLTGKNDTTISTIDVSDFVKDGMISSVELVHEDDKGTTGEFIKITWNTDEGGDITYLDVSELIDVYTAGDGIVVDDHTISVKIDGSSEYISVSSNGVKVSGITDAIDSAVSTEETRATTAESTLQNEIDTLSEQIESVNEALEWIIV